MATQLKKSEYMAHGIDCRELGEHYAGVLIVDGKASLPKLPALKEMPRYNELKDHARREVYYLIRQWARKFLLDAGYPPGVVQRVLAA